MTTRLSLLAGAALLGGSAAPPPMREPPTPVAVITEINVARTSPSSYADYLKDIRPHFRDNLYRDKDVPNGLITREGVAAVDEAIADLAKRSPLPALQPSDLLSLAARDHVLEQGPRGGTGHASADGSRPGDRLKRRGGDIFVAETITYGGPSAAAVVRQLAIDDGVRDRGHRHILFSPEYRYVGAACGAHKTYGTMCVVEFSRTPNGAP